MIAYERPAKAVTHCFAKSRGRTAGTEIADPLLLVYVPEKGLATTRCYNGVPTPPRYARYANSPVPMSLADGARAEACVPKLATTQATRRWALRRQMFEVNPLTCPACHRLIRIVAVITQASVIDQIPTHLRTPPQGQGYWA